MYIKKDLLSDLHNMGLQSTDAVMVHSSMKSIGEVEGGANTVVDAFMEYFGEGLFMTPTHTWAQMSSSYSMFDPETEPACVGIIPNIFRKRCGNSYSTWHFSRKSEHLPSNRVVHRVADNRWDY